MSATTGISYSYAYTTELWLFKGVLGLACKLKPSFREVVVAMGIIGGLCGYSIGSGHHGVHLFIDQVEIVPCAPQAATCKISFLELFSFHKFVVVCEFALLPTVSLRST